MIKERTDNALGIASILGPMSEKFVTEICGKYIEEKLFAELKDVGMKCKGSLGVENAVSRCQVTRHPNG
jgi:hypothetical protein